MHSKTKQKKNQKRRNCRLGYPSAATHYLFITTALWINLFFSSFLTCFMWFIILILRYPSNIFYELDRFTTSTGRYNPVLLCMGGVWPLIYLYNIGTYNSNDNLMIEIVFVVLSTKISYVTIFTRLLFTYYRLLVTLVMSLKEWIFKYANSILFFFG